MKKEPPLIALVFIMATLIALSIAPAYAHRGEEEEIHASISQPPTPPVSAFPINTSRPVLGYIFVGAAATGAELIVWRLFKKKR